jgi:nicotinamidase-related amidase
MTPRPTEDPRAAAAVLFLDLQIEIVKNSRTQPIDTIRSHAGALAQLAALHGLPAFASSVPPGGDYVPEVLDPLAIVPRPRTQTSAFIDASIVADLDASGRRLLVLAGVASEIVVVRTALDAIHAGYTVQIAVDACGGVNPRTEDAAFRRVVQAGGVLTSVTTFGAELTGDFTTELGGKTLGIVYQTLGG